MLAIAIFFSTVTLDVAYSSPAGVLGTLAQGVGDAAVGTIGAALNTAGQVSAAVIGGAENVVGSVECGLGTILVGNNNCSRPARPAPLPDLTPVRTLVASITPSASFGPSTSTSTSTQTSTISMTITSTITDHQSQPTLQPSPAQFYSSIAIASPQPAPQYNTFPAPVVTRYGYNNVPATAVPVSAPVQEVIAPTLTTTSINQPSSIPSVESVSIPAPDTTVPSSDTAIANADPAVQTVLSGAALLKSSFHVIAFSALVICVI